MRLAGFLLALAGQPCKYFSNSLDCTILLGHIAHYLHVLSYPSPSSEGLHACPFLPSYPTQGREHVHFWESAAKIPSLPTVVGCQDTTREKKSNSLFSTGFIERSDWLCRGFKSIVQETVVKTVEKASGLKEVNSLAPDGQSYGSGIKGNHSKRSFMLPVPSPDFPGTGRLYLGLPFLTQFLWSARIPTTCWNCHPTPGHGRSPPSFPAALASFRLLYHPFLKL